MQPIYKYLDVYKQTVVWHRNGNLEKEYDSIEVPEGIYTIQTALSSSKTLDIANGSKANFGNIWIYNINNTEAQELRLRKCLTDIIR